MPRRSKGTELASTAKGFERIAFVAAEPETFPAVFDAEREA